MASSSDGPGKERGGTRAQVALLISSAVVLAVLIVLALSQWFERLS